MKIIRLYADEKGESHFEDVEVKFQAPTKSGRVSDRLPATGIIFREVQPDYDLDWHPARGASTSSTSTRACSSPRATARPGA